MKPAENRRAGGCGMKKYMVYNRLDGPQEGAALAFAHTAQEARKLAYQDCGEHCIHFENFIEVDARLIRGKEYLDKLRKKYGPHIVTPPACDACNLWGDGELVDGLCPDCRQEEEEKTHDLFT
jgi:hypothetical protein